MAAVLARVGRLVQAQAPWGAGIPPDLLGADTLLHEEGVPPELPLGPTIQPLTYSFIGCFCNVSM